MYRIHYYVLLLFAALTLAHCEKSIPTAETPAPGDLAFLIFGGFYGFCLGPTCVETYQLKAGKLYVDQADTYAKPFPYTGEWAERPAAEYALAAPLLTALPEEIWQADQETFGIPDAYDQGGYFIEARRVDGTHRAWRLDTNLEALPEAIRPFAAQVRAVLEELEE